MLTLGATKLLLLAVFLYLLYLGHGQQLPSSATGCSVGPPGPPENLATLTTQQLADGRLNSSLQSSWEFGVGFGAVQAAEGRNVTLACILALNATVSQPTESSVFLQPTAINLGNATGLSMENVLLSTNCSAVLEYQTFFCSSYSVAGSLTLRRGAVHFSDWRDGFTALRNVTLTCQDPAAAPQPPCRLAAVQTAGELLDAFVNYAEANGANATIIVVAANISITNSSWAPSPVTVSNQVTLIGSSRLYRPILDFNLMVALWDLLSLAQVTLVNLTCVNLAPTYISPAYPPSIFGPLTERVRAFRRADQQLHIVDSTLVVPNEELVYLKHWLKYLASPVPEDQKSAAWLNVSTLKIHVVNESGVYYDQVHSYTATYDDVRLTDTLGPSYPLLPLDLGLDQALGRTEDVPLSTVRQVINASDLLIALSPGIMQPDSQGRRWLLLVANFSLADVKNLTALAAAAANRTGGSAVAAAVQLPGSIVLAVGTGGAVRLDLGRTPNVLGVMPGSLLSLRDMILGGLAARAAAYDPAAPLDCLASPLWGLVPADSSSIIDLDNVTLLVSGSELALLQQCLLPAEALPAAAAATAFDGALVSAVKAFFTAFRVASSSSAAAAASDASRLRLASASTQRYSLTNVTFRTPVAADGEGGAPEVVAPPVGGSGGGGRAGWKVGVIVGCAVGVPVLLALAAGLVLAARRRRRQQYRNEEEADVMGDGGGGGGLAKYRHISGAGERPSGGPGGSAGAGGSSDFVNASHELTNSSQVLRPDARRSDLEAAAAAMAASLERAKAASATASGSVSASGGICNPDRTPSTTGGVSHSQDTSSGAALLSGPGGSGGAAAAAGAARAPPALGAAAAVYGGGGENPPHGHGDNQVVTDSFEHPPSTTVLGQHGPVGRHVQRLGSAVTVAPGSSTSVTTSSALTQQAQSILATGGAGALDQMHAMIQVLGRDFHDRQLEVHNLLGKGAHGTVYKGTWRGLPVAVKSMVFSNDSSARQQSRALMEAAISANLAHPNIVTSYSYELREVEHELACISPELARQGGGWRLLIIQEYCDAGPLRRIIDCGYFSAPAKPSSSRPKLRLPSVGLMRKDSPSGEGSAGSVTRVDAATAAAAAAASAAPAAAAGGSSRGSSGSSVHGNGSRASPVREAALVAPPQPPPASPGAHRAGPSASPHQAGPGPGTGAGAAAGQQLPRPSWDSVPSDVPGRPTSALQAARRYVEAALMIARGLQHIHDKNIVHGDLNPNNVLLMRAPGTALGFCLKVADFGLSVRMAEGDSHMSNLFQGSPYYCAPEVVLSGKIGKSADIYSLGIMLWELQHGTRPPWRAGVRLRSYPSLNTGELDFLPETPPRYVRLARDCFHGSKDARPRIAVVVEALAGIKAELDPM